MLAAVSDAELRAFERTWRETGDPQDGAAWLRARVQAGELSEERLRLAACLDHEAACLATGYEGSSPDLQLVDFARRLASFDAAIQVRAALAALAPDPPSGTGLPTQIQVCLAAVRQWLREPTPERAEEAFWAAQVVAGACGFAFPAYRYLGWIPGGIEEAARLLGWPPDDERDSPLVNCLLEVRHRLPDETVAAVQEELIPWALAPGT